jgi:uncharacterized protein YjbI with pentapeptide repeats
MANPDHLNQLRAGQWNEWRAANPTLAPDLIDAQLMGLDLRGLNFSKAHLRGADFTGSQLDGADLSRPILEGARLTNASLTEVATPTSRSRIWKVPFSTRLICRGQSSRAHRCGAAASTAQ